MSVNGESSLYCWRQGLMASRWNSVVRWLVVGAVFTGANSAALFVLVGKLHFSLGLATLLAAEASTLLRFLINDRWVFNSPIPTWRRLWQYHWANAGSFLVWWIVSNALPHLGVHYLIAAIIGTVASVGLSIFTNFRWIWRRDNDAVGGNEVLSARPSELRMPQRLLDSDPRAPRSCSKT